MLITIASVLHTKGGQTWSITPNATVYDAIELMAEKGVGALLVMSGGALVGILSERDYARKVVLQGRHSRDTKVREIMTSSVVTAASSSSVEDCMRIMTERRIRHLPIVDDGRLIGIVSIGDLVRAVISQQAQTIDQLHSYIVSQYPA